MVTPRILSSSDEENEPLTPPERSVAQTPPLLNDIPSATIGNLQDLITHENQNQASFVHQSAPTHRVFDPTARVVEPFLHQDSSTESLGSFLAYGTTGHVRRAHSRGTVLPRRNDPRRIPGVRNRSRHSSSRRSNSNPAINLALPQLAYPDLSYNRTRHQRLLRRDDLPRNASIFHVESPISNRQHRRREGTQVEIEPLLFQQREAFSGRVLQPSPLFVGANVQPVLPSPTTWHNIQQQRENNNGQARTIPLAEALHVAQSWQQAPGRSQRHPDQRNLMEVSVREFYPLASPSRRNTGQNYSGSYPVTTVGSSGLNHTSYRVLDSPYHRSPTVPEIPVYNIPFSSSPSSTSSSPNNAFPVVSAPVVPVASHPLYQSWSGHHAQRLRDYHHETPFYLTSVQATLLGTAQDRPVLSNSYADSSTTALRSVFFPSHMARGMALQELRHISTIRSFEGLPNKDVSCRGTLLRSRSAGRPLILGEQEDNSKKENVCESNRDPHHSIGSESDDEGDSKRICSICCADFLPGEPIRAITLCGHRYHVLCVDRWFEDNSTCPICRSNLKAKAAQLSRNYRDETILEEHPLNQESMITRTLPQLHDNEIVTLNTTNNNDERGSEDGATFQRYTNNRNSSLSTIGDNDSNEMLSSSSVSSSHIGRIYGGAIRNGITHNRELIPSTTEVTVPESTSIINLQDSNARSPTPTLREGSTECLNQGPERNTFEQPLSTNYSDVCNRDTTESLSRSDQNSFLNGAHTRKISSISSTNVTVERTSRGISAASSSSSRFKLFFTRKSTTDEASLQTITSRTVSSTSSSSSSIFNKLFRTFSLRSRARSTETA